MIPWTVSGLPENRNRTLLDCVYFEAAFFLDLVDLLGGGNWHGRQKTLKAWAGSHIQESKAKPERNWPRVFAVLARSLRSTNVQGQGTRSQQNQEKWTWTGHGRPTRLFRSPHKAKLEPGQVAGIQRVV